MTLNNIVGTRNGLGINPWPTFDFNMNNNSPMVNPLYAIVNSFVGMWMGFIMIVAFYWTNVWNTGYLPINSNRVFNNMGKAFNVSKILTPHGKFDEEKFQAYSEPWMAAGNIVLYAFFFAAYAASEYRVELCFVALLTPALSYTYIYHRHQIAQGCRGAWRDAKRLLGRSSVVNDDDDDDVEEDIHYRMMKVYPEVPEWWYFLVLCAAVGVGVAGLAAYPTYTTPAVIIFGIIMALIFVIPLGLIAAITGQTVTLNVLAEFIGGSIVPGDATAMNYFKMYGYITTAHALSFCRDLKMAQYTKIAPRHTFWCQLLGAFVSSFVCVSIWNFQMNFKGICTADAAFKMSCPGGKLLLYLADHQRTHSLPPVSSGAPSVLTASLERMATSDSCSWDSLSVSWSPLVSAPGVSTDTSPTTLAEEVASLQASSTLPPSCVHHWQPQLGSLQHRLLLAGSHDRLGLVGLAQATVPRLLGQVQLHPRVSMVGRHRSRSCYHLLQPLTFWHHT